MEPTTIILIILWIVGVALFYLAAHYFSPRAKSILHEEWAEERAERHRKDAEIKRQYEENQKQQEREQESYNRRTAKTPLVGRSGLQPLHPDDFPFDIPFSNDSIESHPGFVYFVLSEGTIMLKIGYTQNPDSRLKALQTGSHHVLLFALVIPGSPETEAALHKQFADQRRQGEWFELNSDLISHVNDLARKTEYPGISITTK